MPSMRGARMLTKEDITNGLSLLDSAIEGSEILMSVAPLRFITIGGMLAVSLFENRQTTKDIDFLLDPNVDSVHEYRQEVLKVINAVAKANGFNDDWMNDELRIFIRRSHRLNLFFQSVEQDLVAYQGRNMVVYAARLDFALERKLRRLNEEIERPRNLDLSDAVALVHSLKGEGHPLSWEYCQGLDENKLGLPIGGSGIQAVQREYTRLHSAQGVVVMDWNEETQGYRYVNMGGDWVYV